MDPIETVRRTVELDPFVVDEDTTDALIELIVEQSDEIEHDDVATVQTLVLDARRGGLSNHAKVLKETETAEATSNNE